MTVIPRYGFLPGTEITLVERPLVVTGTCDEGYRVIGRDDGFTTVVPFATLVDYLKLPGARINTALPETGGRLAKRLGGFGTAQALTAKQRELGRFHFALVQGTIAYRSALRTQRCDPNLELSERMLDASVAQKFIADVASTFFGEEIKVEKKRGGKQNGLFVYKGRTLKKYLDILESLAPGESPLDALVPLDHLKGNSYPRICTRLRELMTEIWEKVGLDLKCPALSNVRNELEAIIREENKERSRNGLSALKLPADRTIRRHRDQLLTPTEIMLSTKGVHHTRNKRGRGRTDLMALMVGEIGIFDECKISLVTSAKTAGFWERMSEDEKEALEKLDEYIRTRFFILVLLDLASRMPLAWVIAEAPSAEATLALFRMATRDKTREKRLFGCTGEPAAAVGLMHVMHDNGTGLRNATAIGALVGIGSTDTITRTYSATDRARGERVFGTLEMNVFKLLPGYTGRRPGELPGYDAIKNGVITPEELYGIVTRYFIDEYPSTRHYGTGMFGRRPYEVYKTINETRGQIPPIDPNLRRIHLGWEEEVTPSDEGVRVFRGIWFNSDDLQITREEYGVTGKVKVYVDPDNLNFATVVLPNVPDPIEVKLQITAFADMTLPEVLQLMVELRREDPTVTEFHEDQIMRTRRQRRAQIEAIGVEHSLPRSYSTIAECKAKAKAVFAGALDLRSSRVPGTTRPGDLMNVGAEGVVYGLGGSAAHLPDGTDHSPPPTTPDNGNDKGTPAYTGTKQRAPAKKKHKEVSRSPKSKSTATTPATIVPLPRPKNTRKFEE